MNKIFRIQFLHSYSGIPKSRIQNLKWGGILTIVVTFAMCGAVTQAQQPGKIPRIGYLSGGASFIPQAFVQRLRDLGYIEGKNIAFEFRQPRAKRGAIPIS